MDGIPKEGSSLAAPLIFVVVFVLHLLPRCLEYLKKKGLWNAKEFQLHAEIKQLLKEASSLSQFNFQSPKKQKGCGSSGDMVVKDKPSTFAQAAKLRRMAAAKEKELLKSQESHNKKKKLSYNTCVKAVMILKGLTYLALICWFWGDPLFAMSLQLLQPLGKQLSWSARDPVNGNVAVGIVPWLVLSTRVSNLICQKLLK